MIGINLDYKTVAATALVGALVVWLAKRSIVAVAEAMPSVEEVASSAGSYFRADPSHPLIWGDDLVPPVDDSGGQRLKEVMAIRRQQAEMREQLNHDWMMSDASEIF